jgi:hypothetical protein
MKMMMFTLGLNVHSSACKFNDFVTNNPDNCSFNHFFFTSIFYRGGQRYFFGGCAFARMQPYFLRPLALDRNDFKFGSALSAIPL